ncbi:MAG: rRNA maturation RNase YbeY [Dehalococcoidia bacterium]|nr:rRNA maturation RNase YbeY [Dehalococcoidia bacterium]
MPSPLVHVKIGAAYRGLVDKAWLVSVVEVVLESQNVPLPAEAGLTITGQDQIRKLNREYRGLDEPTDVLSFALQENRGRIRKFALPPDGVTRLGDVVISYPQAAAQAAERGSLTEHELALLVVHGMLHLLGYDHMKMKDAKVMEGKEASILDDLFHA